MLNVAKSKMWPSAFKTLGPHRSSSKLRHIIRGCASYNELKNSIRSWSFRHVGLLSEEVRPGSVTEQRETRLHVSPEVLEISVNVIGSEALERKSPLFQIEEEMADGPWSVLVGGRR